MVNFIIALSKLTGLTNCLFWKIHVKLAFTLITHFEIVFTIQDMLNTLARSQY